MNKPNPRMTTNHIHIPYRAPLNSGDTENQTYGCRATSPNICKNHGMAGCAYVNQTGIWMMPPRGWNKHFKELKGE